MKALKMEELKVLDDDELVRRERELRENLFKTRMKLAIGQMSKVADIGVMRRNLARILTVLRQRIKVSSSEFRVSSFEFRVPSSKP